MRWITERQPWHSTEAIDWIVAQSDHAIVGSKHGWVASVDRTTGAFSHERKFAALHGLVDFDDGRLFALVAGPEHEMGTVLDATTLATISEKALPDDPTGTATAVPAVARLPNGRVAISLPGQPLTVYEAKTLDFVGNMNQRADWTVRAATGTAIYASRPNPDYDATINRHPTERGEQSLPTIDIRWMYTQAKSSEAERAPWAAAPNVTFQPVRKQIFGWLGNAVFREDTDALISLDDDYSSATENTVAAFSESGETIALAIYGDVKVYSATTGKKIATYPLQPTDHFRDRHPIRALAFSGSVLYVAYEREVRVIDLEKKTLSSAPHEPSHALTALLVDNGGEVETIGFTVAHFANGKETSSYAMRGTPLLLATETMGITASYDSLPKPGTVVVYRDGKQVEELPYTVKYPDSASLAWIQSTGAPIVWAYQRKDTGTLEKLVEDVGGVLVMRTMYEGDTVDVDAEQGIAITGGTLLDLNTGVEDKQRVPTPCRYHNGLRLERGGTRVATWSDYSLTLYDRQTKKELAAVRIPDEILRDASTPDDPFADVQFLHGTQDLAIRGPHGMALWSPDKNELRVVMDPDLLLAASPDGKSLGVILGDGRVGVTTYDALRAAIPATAGLPPGPAACPLD
jgi:hypothetical protein